MMSTYLYLYLHMMKKWDEVEILYLIQYCYIDILCFLYIIVVRFVHTDNIYNYSYIKGNRTYVIRYRHFTLAEWA